MKNMKCILFATSRLILINKKDNLHYVKVLNRCFSNQSNPNQNFDEPTSLRKVIKVAVLGTPNAGKSTLINKILDRPLCPVSKKVHTTKELSRAACHIDDTQIIFMDTPGLASEKERKKYELPHSMAEACHISKNTADLLAIIYDASSLFPPALPPSVVPFLSHNLPAVLILNKVDLVKKKRNLLDLTRILTGAVTNRKSSIERIPQNRQQFKYELFTENNRGYNGFLEVFHISALSGDGMNQLLEFLIKNAKTAENIIPAPPLDTLPEKFIVQTVRGKLLDFLPQEIPYLLKPELEYYEEKADRIVVAVRIVCPSLRIAKLMAGSGCGRLRQIQDHTRNDLTKAFNMPVQIILQTTPTIDDNIPVPLTPVPIFDTS